MENNKGIGWYLVMDCPCDKFSFTMDTMLTLSCCLLLGLSCCFFV